MDSRKIIRLYQESVDQGIDNYNLLDSDIKKPIKEDYSNWDDYWVSFISYMKEKYRYTYGSKAQKK